VYWNPHSLVTRGLLLDQFGILLVVCWNFINKLYVLFTKILKPTSLEYYFTYFWLMPRINGVSGVHAYL
jgi:hypothetical protein